VIAATLAGWVLVVSLRARRLARPHPEQPAFSVLADGRLPVVVAGLVGSLALGELLAAARALV
jgi:putative membrane protein